MAHAEQLSDMDLALRLLLYAAVIPGALSCVFFCVGPVVVHTCIGRPRKKAPQVHRVCEFLHKQCN